MGFTLGLDTALRALLAQQQAMDVASHNIANANTPGFSRQTVQFTTTPPFTVPTFTGSPTAGQVGTGVQVGSIPRVRDTFVDYQLRNASQSLGGWEVRKDFAGQIETIFNEPSDSGFGTMLSQFWTLWQEVSANPESVAARTSLVGQSENVVATLRRNSGELTALVGDADRELGLQANQVNDIAARIAELNVQISSVEMTGQANANDLRDQRDQLLDQVAKIVKVTYVEELNHSVSIFIGGKYLVHDSAVEPLQAGTATVGGKQVAQVQWARDGSEANVSGGELGGLLELRNTMIPDQIDQLNSLAARLISDVNGIHAAGYNLDDETGVAFLTGTGANDIAVNPAIIANARKIAAAKTAGAPGDGSIALSIARLGDECPAGETTPLNSVYQRMISKLGVASRQAKNMVANQQVVVQHLAERKESTSGVSLDEEAMNLIKYQRAFEAAAKVASVLDGMLDTLINGMGAR